MKFSHPLLKILGLIFLAVQTNPARAEFFHFSHENDIAGDDQGYTGSLLFEYGSKSEAGSFWKARYRTSLYSQRLLPYGNPANPSYAVFTGWENAPNNVIHEPSGAQTQRLEQNTTLSIVLGDRESKSLFGWDFEFGLTQTKSDSTPLPLAGGFQRSLHRLIGGTKYNLVSDGQNTRYGGFVKPTLAITPKVIEGKSLALMLPIEAGGSFDSENRRRVAMLSAGTKMKVGLFEFLTGAESQTSDDHHQVVIKNHAILNFESWALDLGYFYPLTQAGYSDFFETDYVDRDSIFTLDFTLIF